MMLTENCLSIKQILTEHLASHIDVQEIGDSCVVTLPYVTLDRRWVDVFVEPRAADFFVVNDGGKAVNELILQGMKITPSVERDFGAFAGRFGVAYTDETFQTGTKFPNLAASIMAVGMCSTLAMTQLLDFAPSLQEEPIEAQIGGLLRIWGKKRAKITQNVKVNGLLKQHSFDFLLSPRKAVPVSISILNPTAGALSAAERFGFKKQDLDGTKFGKWKSIAVELKAEVWSPEARRIVDKCADAVIQIQSGDKPARDQVYDTLDRMVA